MNNQREVWEKVQELGQGGFGFVCLYRNKDNGDFIAIKQLRFKNDSDASSRIWERWKQEVFMMNKLNHRNVIKAVDVPPELDDARGEMPVLGMEYCNGGDLRKLLMCPENCCGLRESFIRDLLGDVGSAIEYLHNIRIIHRDLKPENIVLQPTDKENRFLYKIIDLGYAKELDSSSLCLSHVGTQQYLAPELFRKQAYTRTVDYWSFGSLIFECITGKRPFCPDLTSVQWHAEISKKSPDDITAYYDEIGDVRFSKTLPVPNYLCRPLRKYLEQWLKLMLRWDFNVRGGGVTPDGSERPKCFCVLEQILNMKIFHVLYAKTNFLLSFPVTEQHTIETVHQAIERQIHVPVSQQLLISRKGQVLQHNHRAIDACQDSTSENPAVFVFCQAEVPENIRKENRLPPLVESIVKDPNIVLSWPHHKEAWKNVVYWCANENHDCLQLTSSQKAVILAFLHRVSLLTKQRTHMKDQMAELVSFANYFEMSLNFDLHQFESNENLSQDMNGTNLHIRTRWLQSAQEAKDFEPLRQQIVDLENHADDLFNKSMELQKKRPRDVQKLEECETNAKKLYENLKVNRDLLDHYPMVDIVGKCLIARDELTKILHESIDQLTENFYKIISALLMIENLCIKIDEKKEQLMMMQRQRQEDVWKVATCSISSTGVNPMAESNMGFMSVMNGNNGTPSFFQSLSTSMESLRLVDDCKNNVQMMDSMLEEMMKEQDDHGNI